MTFRRTTEEAVPHFCQTCKAGVFQNGSPRQGTRAKLQPLADPSHSSRGATEIHSALAHPFFSLFSPPPPPPSFFPLRMKPGGFQGHFWDWGRDRGLRGSGCFQKLEAQSYLGTFFWGERFGACQFPKGSFMQKKKRSIFYLGLFLPHEVLCGCIFPCF